jgi:hypothetical protein
MRRISWPGSSAPSPTSGVTPEVVSGDVEAQLSFSGATGDLIAAEIPAPYLVVDLGGGSTELVRGIRSAEAGFSMDVGSVRMSERHLHSDPPTDHEIASATADVDAAIDKAKRVVDLTGIATLVGLAGSITTVTAHLLGLAAYDPKRIHLSRFTGADHIAAATDLLMMSRDQRAALPYMHPGRVDVIGAGVLVWRRVLERVARGLARCRRGHLGARHPRRHRPVARPLSLSPPHPDHVEREQIAGPATAGPRFAPSRRGRGRAGHRVGRATRQPSTGQRLFSSAH